MTISEIFLPEFEQELTNTRKLLERLPDGNFDYKPHPKSMTLGNLAWHIAQLPGWAKPTVDLDTLVIPPDFKPESPTSKQQILDEFEKAAAQGKEAIAGATDEHLMKDWTLKFGDHVVFTQKRHSVLRNVVINHLIHHRAQLGVYLRLNEIEIPGMYGPSADEMKFWKAEQS